MGTNGIDFCIETKLLNLIVIVPVTTYYLPGSDTKGLAMNSKHRQLYEAIHILYGNDEKLVKKQKDRYENLIDHFTSHFGKDELHYFSTPGRTEIGGNHTDHNHGRVLAASINLDSIAAVSKFDEEKVELYSAGYEDPFHVDLNKLEAVSEENGTTTALIRGVAARFKQLGYKIGGFNACIASDVLPGSGLSSSASIEVLIADIFNALYNENKIDPEILAETGQYAENFYFGKPSGLMDQMACAVGGIIAIDFRTLGHALVKKVDFDFDKQKYSLLVVDTGGNHTDLTDDYSSIPVEMKSVAQLFDTEVLREVSIEAFIEKIPYIRRKVGDRAVLRGLHFLQENERVVDEITALESGNFRSFLKFIEASGNSSFKWLQNIYTTKNIKEQGVSLALALTEKYLADIEEGACRVHGGGFAGTIQVFLPDNRVELYIKNMEKVFGKNSVQVLKIRSIGTTHLNSLVS